MQNILVFDISKLMGESTGARDNYSFEGPVSLDGLKMKKTLKGKVEIMRIEEGFNVQVSEVEAKIELSCNKCLKPYVQPIAVDIAERIYFLNRPSKVEDDGDLFLVDKKHLSVDVSEILRQEIILHFPISSVCSRGCKGLCGICGKNLNKMTCKCKEEVNDYKPLAKLKELLK